jgi:hypothetical protein
LKHSRVIACPCGAEISIDRRTVGVVRKSLQAVHKSFSNLRRHDDDKTIMEIKLQETTAPIDIYLWPDQYWCYRSEFPNSFKEDYHYTLITVNSPEWLKLVATRRPPL